MVVVVVLFLGVGKDIFLQCVKEHPFFSVSLFPYVCLPGLCEAQPSDIFRLADFLQPGTFLPTCCVQEITLLQSVDFQVVGGVSLGHRIFEPTI